MKAFALNRYSKSNGVDEVDVAVPQLREGDVLVQVCAASVNPLDLKIRSGELKSLLPYKLPLILGNDLAGIVVQTAPNVQRFNPGDEVYAKPSQDKIGTFAEYIALNESDVALKPKRLTMEEASSLGCSNGARRCNPDDPSRAEARSDRSMSVMV